jgi:hypothetical protein
MEVKEFLRGRTKSTKDSGGKDSEEKLKKIDRVSKQLVDFPTFPLTSEEVSYIQQTKSTPSSTAPPINFPNKLTKNLSENFFHNSFEIPSNCRCHCSGIFSFLFKKSLDI